MSNVSTCSKGQVFSAICLVGGTCIGGGMLALPVSTGISGFLPSLVVMGVCWLAMTITALLLLEISLWMEDGVHISTMTSRLLGKYGKIVSWILYLFIAYGSLVAYTAAGGGQIAYTFTQVFGQTMSLEVAALIFIVIFGGTLYFGSYVIGRVNAILFVALVASYIGLVTMGVDDIKPNYLLTRNWNGAIFAVPLLLASFSFQTMVPSLTPYLKRHAASLKWAVVGGTTLAFVIYAIWESLMLGIVPVDGPNGLQQALIQGEPITQFLSQHVTGYYIAELAQFFAFFALVTSFLGIGLGLFDFLADGMHISHTFKGNLLLGCLIAIPTYFCAIYFERIFLLALETTGGYGDSILNGIFPILMVWVGRYWYNYKGDYQLPGGKPILIITLCFFVFSILLTFSLHTHMIELPTAMQEFIDDPHVNEVP